MGRNFWPHGNGSRARSEVWIRLDGLDRDDWRKRRVGERRNPERGCSVLVMGVVMVAAEVGA